MNDDFLRQIQIKDLPQSIQDIAQNIGLESMIKIVSLCSGQSIYIPTISSCILKAKSRAIYNEYMESRSPDIYSKLAKKYGYTVTHIRRIISSEGS